MMLLSDSFSDDLAHVNVFVSTTKQVVTTLQRDAKQKTADGAKMPRARLSSIAVESSHNVKRSAS